MREHEPPDEDQLLRAVALQNAAAILAARQRAEQDLVRAKEALEARTRELARSLALTRATLEATTDGILVTDENGVVTDFNERYLALWQLSRDVIVSNRHGRIADTLVRHLVDGAGYLRRIDEIYATWPGETFDVLELRDGRVVERYSRTQVVDGRAVGRVWSFRDVTDERQARERERAARSEAERASAMKDEFLATLSHELRTPLNAILGWAQTLRLPAAAPEDVRRGLESIERNARVQAQLIEDLLDMSRIVSGTLRMDLQPVMPITAVEVALDTVRAAADAKGIHVLTTLDPLAGPVAADPGRLQQIVWNLLSNAIKFTGRDGHVHVRIRRVDTHVEVSVEDTGIGIPREFLPHVFDRFRQADGSSTRSASGLGLGLAIVKQLVELHGGTARAFSHGAGTGATFTVELPLVATPKGSRAQILPGIATSAEFQRLDLSGIKVLVVDDEPDARELVAHIVAECGAEVHTASAAAEALAAIERVLPHVLVSDIGMPEVDGYELLRRVRELGMARGGGLPAIALTAYARSDDRTRALHAGYLAHVAKPVEPTELAATVASVVGRTGSHLRD
jgi:PAS domain S-box-containing protein